MKTSTLTPEVRDRMDAYWRAANDLSVGQIYLFDNPLLKRPQTLADVKHRLLGHWGTTPGQNFTYVQLNRVINKYDLERATRVATLAEARCSGGFAAASAVGQYRDQASRGPPDGLYVEALAVPDTINTMPEQTLLAFAEHGEVTGAMPPCPSTAATPKRCSRNLRARVSTIKPSLPTCSARARLHSPSRGMS